MPLFDQEKMAKLVSELRKSVDRLRAMEKLPLDEFYEEFLNLYRCAYPTKDFIKAVFQRKAVLTPGLIIKNYKFRKRMQALRSHHDQI